MDSINLTESSIEIVSLLKKDKRLATVISSIGPIHYTLHDDGYEFLVHEIIEQMLSVKAGNRISTRLIDICQGKITPVSIAKLSVEEIRQAGMSQAKAQYIKILTEAVSNNQIDLSALRKKTDQEVIRELTSLRGIGNWTAKMYLIFVLGRPDILPYEDGAFLQAYRWLYETEDCTPESIKKKCKKWSPYSSTAARYLYRALDSGMTKSKFEFRREDKQCPV